MNTREDKIKFLQNLQAGKQNINDILPVTFKTFYNVAGVITDNTGKTFTETEINAAYNMTLNKTWVEILTYEDEESKQLYHPNNKTLT